MARSLNKVELIGNLTRDPELRYTPQGTAVCTFGVATNRSWTTDNGEKKEDTEFHRVVAWNKLAELCSQLLSKGRKVYVEGRLQTRQWQTPDGQQRQVTEIVIDDMRMLDSRKPGVELGEIPDLAEGPVAQEPETPVNAAASDQTTAATPTATPTASRTDETKKTAKKSKSAKGDKAEEPKQKEQTSDEDILSDLPF